MALSTTSRRLTSVRSFAKWAGWGPVLEEYSAPPPGNTVSHPLPEGVEGVRRMIEVAPNARQRAMVALCGFVGCRISEALAVRPSDFDLNEKMLRILGKGEKWRSVPISPEAWDVLAEPVTLAFLAGNALVVGIENRTARDNITQLGVKAKLSRRVSSHDLRATFATAAHDKTLDIRLVQELLGHQSVETTQIYVGVKLAKMRDAVQF